jgi:hypothetical protein
MDCIVQKVRSIKADVENAADASQQENGVWTHAGIKRGLGGSGGAGEENKRRSALPGGMTLRHSARHTVN